VEVRSREEVGYLRTMRPQLTYVAVVCVLLGLLAAGVIVVAPRVSARPTPPETGTTPNITECQQYSFRTVVNQTWLVGAFTVKGELQQGYDTNFGAWCYYFRYKTTVSSSSSPGGTLYVDANSCGLKGYENVYSLPAGSFSNYYYSKVAPVAPPASGWWRVYTGSSDYSQYGACGGNH
jgi:hypothetical protein